MATSTSHYVKTVCLKDWWLIKADNNSQHNTLAVAGIESTGQPAARVFISAPIAKRLYFCTLKTADGVFVTLQGPINKERTCENGFSEEVFKYFFIGFPSNWENCAEKCFQSFHQGIGSEATADADLNSDEAQEEIADLQDDQNIDSVEEWSFRDARSNAENHEKDRHATVSVHDRDACVNDDKHDSDVGFREEVVRYSLRNRKVPYFEAKRACKVKHVKNLGKIKPRSKKTTSDDTSTRPLVASLKDSPTPGMTPLCDESPKENAKRPDFAITGGVNDANHAENIAARRSLSGEALSVGNSMHRIKKPHKTNSKVVNSKSHGSKKEGKQRSILTCHVSARPTPRTSASKDKTNSKASASEIEGKTGSTPNLQLRRELDYAEKTCTAKGENETPSSQRSVIKTSRSGRLLLPTLEFWRNQLPIYDADHGICGIKEGSTILKLKKR